MSLGLLPSSNCVINLVPDKRAVLHKAYRVLKVMLSLVLQQDQSRAGVVLLLRCHWNVPNGIQQGRDGGWGQGRAPVQRILSRVALRVPNSPCPFFPLLLCVSFHSLLLSSLGERCTSVMSMPASA